MPQTVRLNKILIYAREEAGRLQNTQVLPEHLLLGVIRLGEGTAYNLLLRAGLYPAEAKSRLDEALRTPDSDLLEPVTRSVAVERILRIAEGEARQYNDEAVGSIHLLLAILREHINKAAAYLESEWNITYDRIVELYPKKMITPKNGAGQTSEVEDAPQQPNENERHSRERRQSSATPSLDKYGRDLTRQASEGRLDPVVGRETEIERVTQILSRRKKNNPILIGEPGVGKSSIVEGLALRIVNHEAVALKNKRIITLDLASMVAGTTYRGQFEERIKNVIQELQGNKDIILFIDEIHTLIGAGNAQGSLDAANILKPALARGEVQCIGATTTNEYRTSIEKDGALERRFQKILVRPTTIEETKEILHRLAPRYADYHRVEYLDDALDACVTMGDRYVTDRSFPDKAIDVMDEAGAKKHAQHDPDDPNRPGVNADDIANVVAMMSGIPVQRVQKAENERLRTMADSLKKRVIGQDEAVNTVVKAIQRSRLGLRDPRRPIGTFFFLGPTGVGKTHLAQCLAEEMFGSKDAVIRFDMSEFMEKHTVSLLVGAPPGYVAHEDGGKLTEAVRRKPYSIVLFDEIEKAHPDIFNVLLQVLDEGRLTDRQGHMVDFKNTIIILTSNVGTRQLKDFGNGIGFEASNLDDKAQKQMLLKALNKTFPPEFVNRIDNVITFSALERDTLAHILDIEIDALRKRLKEQGHNLQVADAVKQQMLDKADTRQYGARPLKRAVQTYLEDKITEHLLAKPDCKTIKISNI